MKRRFVAVLSLLLFAAATALAAQGGSKVKPPQPTVSASTGSKAASTPKVEPVSVKSTQSGPKQRLIGETEGQSVTTPTASTKTTKAKSKKRPAGGQQ